MTPATDVASSLALTDDVVDELTRALSVPAGSGALEQMRLALDAACAAARARCLPADVVAVTVKDAFSRALRPEGISSAEWARRYHAALNYGLEVYFDEAT